MGIVWRRVPDSRHPQHGNSDLSRRVEAAGSGLRRTRQFRKREAKAGGERGKEKGGLACGGDYAHGNAMADIKVFC
jgi:hypothetical protein